MSQQLVKSHPPLIDIGVNLTSEQLAKDSEQVLERALEHGIQHCVLTGTDLNSSEAVAKLCDVHADQFPGLLSCTAGIHPHHASEFGQNTVKALQDLAKLPQVKAIGETGLDFNRNFSTPAEQQRAFEVQLELATELQMPVFMHERDAHQRQFEILNAYRDQLVDGVIHCFTGDKKALFNYLDLDLHIGITGWVCDERRGLELQNIVGNIPLDRLMIETDAPYLLPRNMSPKPKNRRNEPAYLPWLLPVLSEHMGVSQEEIASASSETARRFFRLLSP